ncbi:MAG: Nif11-like leader peptide family RiPP precursor [Clostridia bacterium]|nr:Nif11-like leader peptide family RiPP precursor [Clostridia bacterium]
MLENKKNTYKGIEELKIAIKEDRKIREAFLNINSEEDAIKIARGLGYEVKKQEINQDEELKENMLDAVSGGKGTTVNIHTFKSNTTAQGDGSNVETSITWKAGGK